MEVKRKNPQSKIRDLIECCGGAKALARKTGLSEVTIMRNWPHHGIPKRYFKMLARLSKRSLASIEADDRAVREAEKKQ